MVILASKRTTRSPDQRADDQQRLFGGLATALCVPEFLQRSSSSMSVGIFCSSPQVDASFHADADNPVGLTVGLALHVSDPAAANVLGGTIASNKLLGRLTF